MARRILAWLALVGFVLLLLNLLVFQVQSAYWASIYVLIVLVFFLSSKRSGKSTHQDEKAPLNEDTRENEALANIAEEASPSTKKKSKD